MNTEGENIIHIDLSEDQSEFAKLVWILSRSAEVLGSQYQLFKVMSCIMLMDMTSLSCQSKPNAILDGPLLEVWNEYSDRWLSDEDRVGSVYGIKESQIEKHLACLDQHYAESN